MPRRIIHVREIMTAGPVVSSPDAPLETVARLMVENHCGFIPLLEAGALIGVVTDRDMMARCVARGRNPLELKAGDIMSAGVQTIDADEPIDRAMLVMEQRQVRRLPVVSEGSLVGVLSQADLVANLAPHRGAELVKKISRATWRLARLGM